VLKKNFLCTNSVNNIGPINNTPAGDYFRSSTNILPGVHRDRLRLPGLCRFNASSFMIQTENSTRATAGLTSMQKKSAPHFQRSAFV